MNFLVKNKKFYVIVFALSLVVALFGFGLKVGNVNATGQCVLILTKSVDKPTANVGDVLTYTINISNQGDIYCTGGGVKIQDIVDSNLQFLSETHLPAYNTFPWGISGGYGCPAFPGGSDPCVGGEPLFDGFKLVWSGHEMPPGASGTIQWRAIIKQLPNCSQFNILNQASATAAELFSPVFSNIVHTVVSTPCNSRLIVQKTTIPANDPTVFNINASGSGTIVGGGVGTVTDLLDKNYEVTPGTYFVSETVPSGWSQTFNSCSGVIVNVGETKTCQIVNMKIVQQRAQYCSPGYWKQSQHFKSYVNYSPSTPFSSVFVNAFPSKTLVGVLWQGGGGLNMLGRHTVAALLNSTALNSGLTTSQVINIFNTAYALGTNTAYQNAVNQFSAAENCPLN